MYKLFMDSSALIKIASAGFLEEVFDNFLVFITGDVYNEAVMEGKKRLYQYAEIIESFILEGKLKMSKKEDNKKETESNLAKGEVVTDDLSFALCLQKEQIRCISSAHLLVLLAKKNKISKDKAYRCLERLKPFVRREIVGLVKEDLEW